jgi:radical SAM protein with 4Fe4S-binding SPASM domain
MKEPRYLSLAAHCYFVPGPARAAVYDLGQSAIYALDATMASLLASCLKGLPYAQALKQLGTKISASVFIGDALTNLPFLRLNDTPGKILSFEEVVLKKNQDRQGVWLDVTSGCNLRCLHCYASAGAHGNAAELSLKEWAHVVDALIEGGYQHFTIGGGEPFFWPEIKSFLHYLGEKEPASLTVLTNATLFAEDTFLDAVLATRAELHMTIYSHLAEHHDVISGVSGSWKDTVSGIKRVIARGIPYHLNIPLGAHNQDDLEQTLRFLADLGVPPERAGGNIVYPLGRGRNCDVLPDTKTIFSTKRESYQLPLTNEGTLLYQTCWCGKLLIAPEGDVSPCPSARDRAFVVGNVRKAPLQDILADQRMLHFWGLTLDEVEPCRECEFRYGCYDCRANAYLYSGDLLGKNPYCVYNPREGRWLEVKEQDAEKLSEVFWVRAASFKTHKIGDELAVLNEATGAIHLLNQVSAEVYALLDGTHLFAQIVAHILERYDVDEATAKKDVLRVVGELGKLEIITDARG